VDRPALKALMRRSRRAASTLWSSTRSTASPGPWLTSLGSSTRGALFPILKSRLYLGEIVHKGAVHPGLHEPIIDQEAFEAVQRQLQANASARRQPSSRSGPVPLKGRIFDQDGAPMSPTFAYGKGGKAFRYYVSAPLQQGQRRSPEDDAVRRVSAPQLESLIIERLQRLGRSLAIATHVRRVEVRSHSVVLTLAASEVLAGHSTNQAAVTSMAERVGRDDRITLEADGKLRLVVGVRPVFRGGRTWLVSPQGTAAAAPPKPDARLINALRRAHQVTADHYGAPTAKLDILRNASSPADSYLRKLIQLAFLTPDIQGAIIEGRQPAGLTVQQILDRGMPAAWADQRRVFGFP
jgi:site-specific DNA recombinase